MNERYLTGTIETPTLGSKSSFAAAGTDVHNDNC